MSPGKSRARCQICNERESKYTCPGSGCLVEYCSVPCYKQHKETSCNPKSKEDDVTTGAGDEGQPLFCDGDDNTKEVPLRPLTSLKWPYVPEESTYPDPLKRDDPKPLQTAQYEAIATSPAIRAALAAHPGLKEVLRTIDGLRGSGREEALQAAVGVLGREDVGEERGFGSEVERRIRIGEGERYAVRGLAEAIEKAVRPSRDGLVGLNWEENGPDLE